VQDRESFAAFYGLLAGVLFVFGRDVVLGKVPLRFGAGLSAGAQVGPIDAWHPVKLLYWIFIERLSKRWNLTCPMGPHQMTEPRINAAVDKRGRRSSLKLADGALIDERRSDLVTRRVFLNPAAEGFCVLCGWESTGQMGSSPVT
jgi:hypothetical protein